MAKPTSSPSNSNTRVKGKTPKSAPASGTGAGAVGSKLPPPGSYRKTPSPSPSTPSSKKPTPIPNAGRPPIRPVTLILPSLAIFAFTAYGTYLYTTYTRAIQTSTTLSHTTLPTDSDVSDRYNTTYPTYDSEVDTSEWLMNLPKRRRELVQKARGDVLEVSCGTGRNLEFFEIGERRGVREGDGRGVVRGVRSLTLVDRCAGMVGVARAKFGEIYPEGKGERGVVRFLAQDAMERVSAPPTSKRGGEPFKFDTVVQTMGLCSHPEPVELLRHLGTITEPENGQILLLEHGRSHYKWLNRILDGLAAAHADRHGCWWNRDIGDVVERSGLVVVERKRWHLGTTWGFVLRPAAKEEGKGEK
ncbi:hypothetical protein FQN54_008473 [Arachnomyces sp. PD_36]|nr:hypothetical protein FQN54_008473 [Arachnomyces sp. PD_36]